MAELPKVCIFADAMFDADPIGKAVFEAGFAACDWTPDRLNGALYMTTSWLAQVAACVGPATTEDAGMVVLWDGTTAADGSDDNDVITVGNFSDALEADLCMALAEKGVHVAATCGTGVGTDGFHVQRDAAGEFEAVYLDGVDITADVPRGACFTCPNGEMWCLTNSGWEDTSGAQSLGPDFSNAQKQTLSHGGGGTGPSWNVPTTDGTNPINGVLIFASNTTSGTDQGPLFIGFQPAGSTLTGPGGASSYTQELCYLYSYA